MVNPLVVDNWATALLDVSLMRHDNLEAIVAEIKDLLVVLQQTTSYLKMLAQPTFPLKTKLKLLEQLWAKRLTADLYHFICLVVRKNRVASLTAILKITLKKFYHLKHEYFGQVYSVIKLTPKQMEQIRAKLYDKFAVVVKLINILDQSLIGGVKVCFQDYVFDSSIKELLASWRQKSLFEQKEV